MLNRPTVHKQARTHAETCRELLKWFHTAPQINQNIPSSMRAALWELSLTLKPSCWISLLRSVCRDRSDPETSFTHQLNWGWQSSLLYIPKLPLCSHFKHLRALQETDLLCREGKKKKKPDQFELQSMTQCEVWTPVSRDRMTVWYLTQIEFIIYVSITAESC